MINRKSNSRLRSKTKIRKKTFGTAEKPRLTVYRSLNNMYAQLIDDAQGVTLASASSLNKEIETELKDSKGKVSKSKLVGSLLAKKASEKNIVEVIFDRNGYRYHGRVKSLAEGAREGGLKF
ncbi:MAG: 50S ribosomal protein L18 [Ignavibacteriaceae bacterium]|nr:50S ribosomal protein L18 [Ignavibacteriaceae bacterium]